MKIIKLNSVDSTNSFLKELSKGASLKNLTVVVAKEQSRGRGQMGTSWSSEPYKNLLCSVFFSFDKFPSHRKNYLSYAVCLSIFETLTYFNVPKLKIKWPNDILSADKKIGGVLIENTLKNKQIACSIIGIGLNVNQETFQGLPMATSVKNEIQKRVDLDYLLDKLLFSLKKNVQSLVDEKYQILQERYLDSLYKKDITASFKDGEGHLFKGKITGVSPLGELQIQKQDGTFESFGIKDVSFVF